MTGRLYGVGVGPGDPDLLTLRAVRYLGSAEVVYAARSTKNEYSRALEAARPHLRDGVEIIPLGFPMTRDQAELDRAWSENAALVAGTLTEGKDAVFLTLGDPMLYSTFGYLLRRLRRVLPEAEVLVAPGITSFQEAAAKSGTVLAESGGTVLVASGLTEMSRLRERAGPGDTVVVLKAYRNFEKIRDTLEDMGLAKEAVFASRLGMDGEIVLKGLDEVSGVPHYLSLLIVPGGHGDD